MSAASDIATQAAALVSGARNSQHGDKAENFARIAQLWSAYLDVRRKPSDRLNAVDVGHMMALLKIARTQSGAVSDEDWVDGCGYLACAGEIATGGAA